MLPKRKVMSELTFIERHGVIIDPLKTKPINQLLLNQYKQALTEELQPYIEEINACTGYILITIGQDGQTFRSLPVTPGKPDLFARIIDEVHSK